MSLRLVFFLMIRRPPRSTLFPYTTPSDLGSTPRSGAAAPRCPSRWRTGGRARKADRKSTRLNSSHVEISYAVFCLKKKIEIVEVASGTVKISREEFRVAVIGLRVGIRLIL